MRKHSRRSQRDDPWPDHWPASPLRPRTWKPLDGMFRVDLVGLHLGRDPDAPLVAVVTRGKRQRSGGVYRLVRRVLRRPDLIGRHPHVLTAAEAGRRGLVRDGPLFESRPTGDGYWSRMCWPGTDRVVTDDEFAAATGHDWRQAAAGS